MIGHERQRKGQKYKSIILRYTPEGKKFSQGTTAENIKKWSSQLLI